LNEIKMGVLAKSVVYPGINTFIMNLITSFSDDAFQQSSGDGDHNAAEAGESSRSDALFGDENDKSGGGGGFSTKAWLT